MEKAELSTEESLKPLQAEVSFFLPPLETQGFSQLGRDERLLAQGDAVDAKHPAIAP